MYFPKSYVGVYQQESTYVGHWEIINPRLGKNHRLHIKMDWCDILLFCISAFGSIFSMRGQDNPNKRVKGVTFQTLETGPATSTKLNASFTVSYCN